MMKAGVCQNLAMTRRISPLALGILVAAIVAGCATSEPWDVVEQDGHLLLVAAHADGPHPNAYVQGELVRVGGVCYGLEAEFGAVTVAFPSGTRIVDDGALDIPGRGTVALGDWVEGAGGTLSLEGSALFDRIPAACAPGAMSSLNPFTP